MARDFEIFDHTADVGIVAYGTDAIQAFTNAARGLFSLIVEPDEVEEVEYRDIEVTAPDQEALLVAWLNELLYFFDAETMLFKRLDVRHLSNTRLEARAHGELADSGRHKLKLGVKAATYHMLEIDRGHGVRARVLFDI